MIDYRGVHRSGVGGAGFKPPLKIIIFSGSASQIVDEIVCKLPISYHFQLNMNERAQLYCMLCLMLCEFLVALYLSLARCEILRTPMIDLLIDCSLLYVLRMLLLNNC